MQYNMITCYRCILNYGVVGCNNSSTKVGLSHVRIINNLLRMSIIDDLFSSFLNSSGLRRGMRWLSGFLICRSQVQISAVTLFRRVITSSKLFTHIYSGQLSLSSFRGRYISTSFGWGSKSFCALVGLANKIM